MAIKPSITEFNPKVKKKVDRQEQIKGNCGESTAKHVHNTACARWSKRKLKIFYIIYAYYVFLLAFTYICAFHEF